MRMRRKKHGTERLASCTAVWIQQPREHRGNWAALFPAPLPLHLEIGCGKGGFITQLAAQSPGANFVALEQNRDVLILAAEKAERLGLTNVKFIYGNALELPEVFAPGEISRIYLNFSDPWHKKRHHKRRLTHQNFLELYRQVLLPAGEIHMKTDNVDLFDFSVDSLAQNGFALGCVTHDFHGTNPTDNVMTEYETLFAQQGKPICRLEATL